MCVFRGYFGPFQISFLCYVVSGPGHLDDPDCGGGGIPWLAASTRPQRFDRGKSTKSASQNQAPPSPPPPPPAPPPFRRLPPPFRAESLPPAAPPFLGDSLGVRRFPLPLPSRGDSRGVFDLALLRLDPCASPPPPPASSCDSSPCTHSSRAADHLDTPPAPALLRSKIGTTGALPLYDDGFLLHRLTG